jgi:hypothetical protein
VVKKKMEEEIRGGRNVGSERKKGRRVGRKRRRKQGRNEVRLD